MEMTCHTKTKKNLKVNEKQQSINVNTMMAENLGLLDKDFKMINCFNEKLLICFKQMKKKKTSEMK